MPINPVSIYPMTIASYEQSNGNFVDYTGYKLSSKGNLYKESNSAKIIGPLVALPLPLIANILAKSLNKKTMTNSALLGHTIRGALMWLGIGTIIDKIIDSSRAKGADELVNWNSNTY